MSEQNEKVELKKPQPAAGEVVIKRPFNSLIATGVLATLLCFGFTMIYWPLWGTIAKSFILSLAGQGLQLADPKTASKFISVFAEGSFFWLIISPWVWLTLVFGNYGKTSVTKRQPGVGIWYVLLGCVAGIAAFFFLIGFLGIWWKPFSLAILFTPTTADEVHLAIEGWEAANFYALMVIIAQIPCVSLFQKWPFAGNLKAPWDGFGVMMFGTVFALIAWFALVIPSFWKLSIGEHAIVCAPMGSWPSVAAFCQCFIFWFLMPAEGGESYPMKLFAKKQPYMGLAGLVIAVVMGFVTLAVMRPIAASLNLMPGAPVDLVVAILVLAGICTMLTWHHLFEDFPSAAQVPNQAARVLSRIAIWVVLGSIFGILWIKTYKMIPFSASDMGYPTMGPLAGQFAYLMVVLYYNTAFDKWLVVKRKIMG